jgi:hypothetical protein
MARDNEPSSVFGDDTHLPRPRPTNAHAFSEKEARSLSDLERLSEGIGVRVRIFMSLRSLCEHQ